MLHPGGTDLGSNLLHVCLLLHHLLFSGDFLRVAQELIRVDHIVQIQDGTLELIVVYCRIVLPQLGILQQQDL